MVTPPVKLVTLRTMRLDVPSIPRTIVAAKAAPGKVGNWTRPVEGVEGREETDGRDVDTVRAQGR